MTTSIPFERQNLTSSVRSPALLLSAVDSATAALAEPKYRTGEEYGELLPIPGCCPFRRLRGAFMIQVNILRRRAEGTLWQERNSRGSVSGISTMAIY